MLSSLTEHRLLPFGNSFVVFLSTNLHHACLLHVFNRVLESLNRSWIHRLIIPMHSLPEAGCSLCLFGRHYNHIKMHFESAPGFHYICLFGYRFLRNRIQNLNMSKQFEYSSFCCSYVCFYAIFCQRRTATTSWVHHISVNILMCKTWAQSL